MKNIVRDHDKRLLASGEYRGFKWECLSNRLGFRCGYVAIPRGHPWFEQPYYDLPIRCHGGLTFGFRPYKPAETYEINGRTITMPECEERRTTDGDDYWVGFDCSHCFDSPDPALYFLDNVDPHVQQAFSVLQDHGNIRTTEYVEADCRSIIDQLILARIEAATSLRGY